MPAPPHHGQVTSCGLPPRPEISWPVPRHGVQVARASSEVALIALTIAAARGSAGGPPLGARARAATAGQEGAHVRQDPARLRVIGRRVATLGGAALRRPLSISLPDPGYLLLEVPVVRFVDGHAFHDTDEAAR